MDEFSRVCQLGLTCEHELTPVYIFVCVWNEKKDNFDDEEYATLTTGYEPMYNAYDDAYDDAGYHEVILSPTKTPTQNKMVLATTD